MLKPNFLVYVERETDVNGAKIKHWNRVGSAFSHKDGAGLNVILRPGRVVSGKLVLLKPKDESGLPTDPIQF